MKDAPKKGILKQLFGQKPSCCSFDIEEIEPIEQKTTIAKSNAPSCCWSTSEPLPRMNKDMKE